LKASSCSEIKTWNIMKREKFESAHIADLRPLAGVNLQNNKKIKIRYLLETKACSMGEKANVHKSLVTEPQGRRGRIYKCRWQGNNERRLMGTGCVRVEYIKMLRVRCTGELS
jgi:hypothetical protein